MPFDAKAMGTVIHRIRKKKRITQEVLSGFADVGRSHLEALEAGHTAKVQTYAKIGDALDIPLSELFRQAEEEMNKTT